MYTIPYKWKFVCVLYTSLFLRSCPCPLKFAVFSSLNSSHRYILFDLLVLAPIMNPHSTSILLFNTATGPEAEFFDIMETTVLKVILLAIHCHLYKRILPPSPLLSKSGLKLVCNVCKHCIRKPQVWELSRSCPEFSTKLNIHEFGFWIHQEGIKREKHSVYPAVPHTLFTSDLKLLRWHHYSNI